MNTPLTDKEIIKKGHLTINLPVILLVVFVVNVSNYFHLPWLVSVLGGSFIGWFVWGKLVERWRDWAMASGISREELITIAKQGHVSIFAREFFQKIIFNNK